MVVGGGWGVLTPHYRTLSSHSDSRYMLRFVRVATSDAAGARVLATLPGRDQKKKDDFRVGHMYSGVCVCGAGGF